MQIILQSSLILPLPEILLRCIQPVCHMMATACMSRHLVRVPMTGFNHLQWPSIDSIYTLGCQRSLSQVMSTAMWTSLLRLKPRLLMHRYTHRFLADVEWTIQHESSLRSGRRVANSVITRLLFFSLLLLNGRKEKTFNRGHNAQGERWSHKENYPRRHRSWYLLQEGNCCWSSLCMMWSWSCASCTAIIYQQ